MLYPISTHPVTYWKENVIYIFLHGNKIGICILTKFYIYLTLLDMKG